MMMERPPGDPDLYRLVGSLVGASSGLLFLWPKTIREAIARGVMSVFFGFGLYFVPIKLLNWVADTDAPYNDIVMGGAIVSAFLAWPLAGVIIKAVGKRVQG